MDIGFLLNNTAALAGFIYSSPFGILILFLFTIAANASIFLPILVEPIVFTVAALAPNPGMVLFIGILTGIASAIGEMAGYIFGLFGAKTLQKLSKQKLEKIFEIGESLADYGIPIVFFGALTPFPFDIIGIAAGVVKYDPKRFFLATAAGKVFRYTIIAFAGYWGVAWLRAWLMV